MNDLAAQDSRAWRRPIPSTLKNALLTLCSLLVLLLSLPGVAAAGSNGDPDRDSVDNRNERREGTDPHRRDSDRDGRPDGREDADRDGLDNALEDATGNDPVDRDSDDDGVGDAREGAGTVESFADRMLVIRLAGGERAVGIADEFTDLVCPTEAGYERGQGRPARAYRRGKRSHHRRRGAKSRAVRAAAIPEDDEGWTDEEPVDDEPAEDEDLGDDEWTDDDSVEDDEELVEDEPAADATGPCAARLAPGVGVHASTIESDEDGTRLVVTLELVR